MRTGTLTRWLVAITAALLIFGGCSLSAPEVSIEERIDDFESDLNSDNWTSLHEHIHPDNGKRNSAKDRSYWEAVLDGPDYNFTGVSNSGEKRDVSVENNNSTTAEHPANDPWKFKMKEDKPGALSRSTWYIDGITSEGGTDPLP
jgi:hypothetical protein